ncbi:MAG: hypothetical protein IJ530_11465 [Treponema sp.]|uniref:hypothetical protein n=1 Tax=Treponema sp. TaxID=166 RepID=UPI0025E978E5|nr:hypothetical protein [Treponema sp.]MBQ8680364.1 hypothetical protein [Treponema sp.]
MKSKMKLPTFLNRLLSVGMVAVAMTVTAISCSFFDSIKDSDTDNTVSITSLALGKSTLSMAVGGMDYVSVSIKPSTEQKNVKLSWSYDKSIISCDTSSNWGVTITAVAEGQTSLKCSYGGYDATCIVTVSGYEEGYETTTEPYIYSNTTILQTSPGVSEKVFVSLYGGDASDIDGYTWTIDNASVASIQPTGQYCIITAKDSGYSRIKVTHTKASYPYYIGVYVFEDATNVTYITTGTNILTMNKDDDEQNITVSLVNGKDSSLDSSFVWQIVNQDSTTTPIGLEYNGNNAVITPLESGSCTLRVTHPDAPYPLDILCRVITVVKNVYIQPDSTIVYLDGDTEQTVTSSLQNINESEYSIDDYTYTLDNYDAAEIVSEIGNQVILKGKANGSTKLLISHPKAAYAREVLLIVTGQLTDAIDASCYITTSQNYIRTKVGADPTSLLVSLKGGEDGDESNFVWSVKSTPDDGVSDVINLETTNGTAVHSRAAASTYAYGNAYITPKAIGTAVITVTHPKIVYPTEILIKVLSEDAILEESLYFTGSGLVRVLNGESTDYTVQLKGSSKTSSDDTKISWSIDDSRLSVVGSDNVATITAPTLGTGSTISHLTASHSKADSDKSVLVMTADDEETLMSMKALYSDKLYYNFEVGSTASVCCNAVGFEDEDSDDEYDWSLFNWTIGDPSVISVEKDSDYPLMCTVTGLKSGTSKLTGSITDSESGTTYTCEFTMTVYPVGAVQTEPEVYFTTTQNVVSLGEGNSSTVSVTAVNLSSSEYSNITWECENSDVAIVVPNENKATITGVTEGETVINVTHADSQNTLKIYVRVGSEYVLAETDPVVYISATDVLTMLRDDSSTKLQAVLVNYDGTDTSGFSFEIDDESVATISAQSTSGIAYIKPVASGQAQVTISHTKSELTKKVLILVGNSAEELAGITYLTTSSNVVSIGEGNTKSVSVSVQNAESVVLDGYTWTSSNPSCVGVTATGATAVLTGNSVGTAIITVSNTSCQYSLQIIAQVVDPIAASASPYIQLTSSVMTLTVSSTYNSITADLVGGDESDYSDFVWTTNDSSIAVVYGQNEVGKIRAMSAGTTYITVSHPKAAYSAQLLVVCDEASTSECYISVPSSIISMKPTDSSQTITASLVNGATTDKYNFTWSLDVYDIIDFQYSANVCTITPQQTGTVTITISHPKAAYDQQIIVNVQQYSSFSFPNENLTITKGDVKFLTMEVPTTTISTYVEYSVENSEIVTITGTKSTAQLTGVGSGTTTVYAKLIASSTGIVQATSEMLVYVKEKDTAAVYITASSTIATVSKGKSQTLSATLVGTGVVTSDHSNLQWTTSDSDIVQVTGIGSDGYVTGQSIYITALKSGEAIITCSHEKAASNLQFYVVVPGTAEKVISLNKTYITMLKGSSGASLKATIENAESSADYYDIEWTVQSTGSEEVCRIMGSGQNVTVYPLAVGTATVMAQLPDSETVATCDVVVQANKSLTFETTTRKVQPFHSKVVNYTVSPADAILTWTMSQIDDYFEYKDLGCDSDGNGQVEISGIKEGSGTLACVTDGGAKGTISVNVAWDYEFAIKGSTTFTITPVEEKTVEYSVNPADADIHVESTACNNSDESLNYFKYDLIDNGDGTGSVVIKPITECPDDISIKIIATNPNKDDEEIGTKVITAKFVYSSVNIKPTFIKSDGKYSYIEGNSIFVGDGETVEIGLNFDETNTNATITNVVVNNLGKNSKDVDWSHTDSDSGFNHILLKSLETDTIVYDSYKINWATRPEYYPDAHGSVTYICSECGDILSSGDSTCSTPSCWKSDDDGDYWLGDVTTVDNGYTKGTRTIVPDWKTSLEWTTYDSYQKWTSNRIFGGRITHTAYIGYVGIISLDYSKREVEDTSPSSARPMDYNYQESPYRWCTWIDCVGGNNNHKLGFYWDRINDPEETGKIYSKKDFESIAWWYCPGLSITHSKGSQHGVHTVTWNEGIMTENVSATALGSDTTIRSNDCNQQLVITYNHNGNPKTISFNVYYTVRYCNMDYIE